MIAEPASSGARPGGGSGARSGGASGRPRHDLSDAELDRLLASARAAEAAGRLDDALGALTVVNAELAMRGETYPYLFEWMAQLESALGQHDAAEELATLARDLALEAGNPAAALRMDVLRARTALEALELERAEALLADLRAGSLALGAPIPARLDAIITWLRELAIPDTTAFERAVLRTETALAIAELWSERGRYASAAQLLGAIEPELPAARAAVRADQVQLLRAELLVAAGRFAEAHAVLDGIPPQPTAADRGRVALVRVRAALAGGQLARADRELAALAEVPIGDPMLFASAAATRVAVEAELNALARAMQIAAEAAAQLTATGTAPPDALALVERARCDAAARSRSALALWELPYVVGAGAPAAPPPLTAEPAGARWRLTTAWTAAANAVLLALESGDVTAAAAEQARLEALARPIESDYVAARVALSGAIVAYHAGTGDVSELLAVAARLQALGARLAEAQAVRFAGWAAARRQRYADHAALARRASAIVDEIGAELDVARRGAFMRNKWSGRDELVEHRLRTLLAGTPTPRELCRAFREIDRLTHQSVDEALGDLHAAALSRDATPHEVSAWLATDAAVARARRSRTAGLAIRSAWSLWRIPARTLILHYHVLPDRTFLFRIARRHIDVRILPYGRVHFALDMCAAADDDEQLRCLAASTGIADAVASFPGIDRLVIVPHDAIASVPFAALPIGDRRLCELGPIIQLDRIARLRRGAIRRPAGPVLSVGRTRYGGTLPDLPAAEREALAVAEVAGAAPPLLSATRAGVLAALPGATRLHVAAHGIFDARDPARSGIVLGGEDGRPETLTLRELRDLDLRSLRLATLATCRSAEHARLPGRERICLPTSLLDAGARGVIASLWPVEDEPSLEIMRALYTRLRTARPAAALAQLQAEHARRPAESQIPARLWAGLVFYGNE